MSVKINMVLYCFIAVLLFCGCDKKSENIALFTKVNPKDSGVDFKNEIHESDRNYFNYTYNGGGVAIGDINNDGLQDLYFTGNESPNKLYLNKGDFNFEDITLSAGVVGDKEWQNGVVMEDVNQDGLMDIYVCRGGWKHDSKTLRNYLYINQGDLTFKEQATKYGLEEIAFSTQASFFDYDNDNDLDVYIANRPDTFFIPVQNIIELRKTGDSRNQDKLYRNDGGVYTDVSEEAGIINNFGYALSVTTSDVNNDGFIDIYVANDFVENDYLYLNNGDGTFSENIKKATNHISFYSMGSDIADINNDGYEDIFVTEMLPQDYRRSKTTMATMNRKGYQEIIDHGIHNQYMHNVLQLNMRNGFFNEIAYLSGVSKTDWSWSVLMSDFNNNGWNDIFISNGIKRDILDRDSHIKKRWSDQNKAMGIGMPQNNNNKIEGVWDFFPQNKIPNYLFKNNENLTFSDISEESGIKEDSFSNGAAIGDLDNDGDLDLVINNVDDYPFIYKNNSESLDNNYLRLDLKGPHGNLKGLGSKVTIFSNGSKQYKEFKVTRGFLSSQEHFIHFGVKSIKLVDSIKVKWPDGKVNTLYKIPVNQVLQINYKNAVLKTKPKDTVLPVLIESTKEYLNVLYKHKENPYDDYQKQVLLPHKFSNQGPFITVGDINNDQLEDFYIGGAKDQPGTLYIQTVNKKFKISEQSTFNKDSIYEDIGSHFFDADGDGDLDLYVVSGGYEFDFQSEMHQDRLYINNGKGKFKRAAHRLPVIKSNGSCVETADYDNDGDLDIFIGGNVIPGFYPYPGESYLLENDGKGTFKDVTNNVAPKMKKQGLVTSVIWNDFDNDGWLDLFVVGEWMPITIYKNSKGKFTNITKDMGLESTTGWWNKIVAADIDQDGDQDFIVGNIGKNYKFKASLSKPFHVYANDFDLNGSCDVFLAKYAEDKQVPVRGKQCATEQLPSVGRRFDSYKSFADATIGEILGEGIDYGLHYEAKIFESVILEKTEAGFEVQPLEKFAQISSVQGILAMDFTQDGKTDILLAGNKFESEIETSRADASTGLLLERKDGLNFKAQLPKESGFFVPYNVKDLQTIKIGKTNREVGVLVGSNNDTLRIYKLSF